MPRRGYAACLVVEICRDVILEAPQGLYDELGRPCVSVLPESLVDSQTSTSLCVRSSSDLSPLSSVIEGLTVIGGTGRTFTIVHSGRLDA